MDDKPNRSMGHMSSSSLLPMSEDFSLNQPEVGIDDSAERKRKIISRSKRWKDFVEFARKRQDLYREYMPGFNPIIHDVSDANWKVATCIIKEYETLINYIEGAEL